MHEKNAHIWSYVLMGGGQGGSRNSSDGAAVHAKADADLENIDEWRHDGRSSYPYLVTPATFEEPRADHHDFQFHSSTPGRTCRSKRSVRCWSCGTKKARAAAVSRRQRTQRRHTKQINVAQDFQTSLYPCMAPIFGAWLVRLELNVR